MEYLRPQNLHKILVDNIFEFLKEKGNRGLINNNDSGRRQKITLKTGETIYPDMVDFEREVVYEIHVKGERRGNYLDKLPDGWRGINVFYEEEDNPETLVVKFITNDIQIIKWQGPERYEKYKNAIKPHIQSLKEHIKKEGLYGEKGKEIMFTFSDLLKIFGMSDKTSMYGVQHVLFFEGIFARIMETYVEKNNRREKVFEMRERVEGDILPASLAESYESYTRKEELMKRFSDWLDKHNLEYIGDKVFDVEFHVFQTIEKQKS